MTPPTPHVTAPQHSPPAPPPAPRLGPRRRTDPALTFAKLADVYSPHCGIITGIHRLQPRDRIVTGAFGYAAELESATLLGSALLRERRASGEAESWRRLAEGRMGTRVAYDRTRALARAVGEALERYACGAPDPAALVTGTWRDLRSSALDPRTLQHPSVEEYARMPEHAPFREDASMRWAWAWSLRDHRHLLVPAQTCWLLYNPLDGEPFMAPPSSTGWAVHHTREEAIHTGLREVIERDAFALTWLHRLRHPQLDLSSVRDAAVAAFRDAMAKHGADLRVLVTTTDLGVASVLVIVVDRRPGNPAFLMTTAAHPDPLRAVRQACEEAAMVHLDFSARVRSGIHAPARMEDIATMGEHAEYYLDAKNLAPLEWMLEEGDTLRMDDLESLASPTGDVWEETLAMTTRVAKAGLDTLVVDGTPPDLREAGWNAAKVLVPGSVRHEYGYGARLLACPRIFAAPVRMGRRSVAAAIADLNTDAHPYS